jgi:hypothetical protein
VGGVRVALLVALLTATETSVAQEDATELDRCVSSAEVQHVISANESDLKRACWEHTPTTAPEAKITVTLNVGTDGTPRDVTASGTEPSVAKCAEQEVRAWRFPAHDCGVRQPVSFSLHFRRP